jgi:hypothetical protein
MSWEMRTSVRGSEERYVSSQIVASRSCSPSHQRISQSQTVRKLTRKLEGSSRSRMSDWTRREVAREQRDLHPPDSEPYGLSIIACENPSPERIVPARASVVVVSSWSRVSDSSRARSGLRN